MIEYKQVPTDQVDDTGALYEYAEVDADGKIQAFKRADGSFDIPVELPEGYLEVLEDMAKTDGTSLNDFMIKIIMEEIARTAAPADQPTVTEEGLEMPE
jgi:predicted HicB family RNase H-like nuclease